MKKRKTPKAEIELAKKYKKDHEYRTEKEGNYGGRSSEVFGKQMKNPEFQAERSGIRQSNISRIENGMCSPTIAA